MWTKLCVRVELMQIGYGAAMAVCKPVPGTAVQRARGEHGTCTDAYGAVDECAGCTGCRHSTGGAASTFVAGVTVETSARCAHSATRCGWGIDEWGMKEDTSYRDCNIPQSRDSYVATSRVRWGCGVEAICMLRGIQALIGIIPLFLSCVPVVFDPGSQESWHCWILHFSGSTGHSGKSKERVCMSFTSLASHITIFELSRYIAEQWRKVCRKLPSI
ncbi:hypothetical protein B0H14DRAFT_2642290 [Mycena olivaceomarginata]|nr:hypothetical protein B0H14DRAFT_2642290 [Mycena olivaceomarginata]